jgi:hypothetical protein
MGDSPSFCNVVEAASVVEITQRWDRSIMFYVIEILVRSFDLLSFGKMELFLQNREFRRLLRISSPSGPALVVNSDIGVIAPYRRQVKI